MIYSVLLMLLWIVYSIYEGKREAWFFARGGIKLKRNIHFYFTLQRTTVFIAFVIAMMQINIDWYFLIELAGMVAILGGQFVFWHDGYYYKERNNIDKNIYIKRFKDYNDSDAVFDFTWAERKILFVFSLVVYLVYCLGVIR